MCIRGKDKCVWDVVLKSFVSGAQGPFVRFNFVDFGDGRSKAQQDKNWTMESNIDFSFFF